MLRTLPALSIYLSLIPSKLVIINWIVFESYKFSFHIVECALHVIYVLSSQSSDDMCNDFLVIFPPQEPRAKIIIPISLLSH